MARLEMALSQLEFALKSLVAMFPFLFPEPEHSGTRNMERGIGHVPRSRLLCSERTGKMPITYVSLLRRRKIIKRAYVKGTELLNNHRLHVSLCCFTLNFDELDTCAAPKNTESWSCATQHFLTLCFYLYI